MKEGMSLLERASAEARFQAGLMQFNGGICGLSSAAWRKHQHGPTRNQGRRKRARGNSKNNNNKVIHDS